MAEPSQTFMRIRIAFAIIGFFVGLSIFFTFGLAYTNWDCAVWGLMSGIFAGLTLLVHLRYNKNKWQVESGVELLRMLMLTGCFVQLAGVCGFVAYLAIAVTEGQGLSAYGRGYYVTAVWCWMTWKWGFGLFYYSRSYRRLATGYEEIPDGDYDTGKIAKV